MAEKEETEPEEDFVPSEEYEDRAIAALDGTDGEAVAQVYATLALAATLRESTLVMGDIFEALLDQDDPDSPDDPDAE